MANTGIQGIDVRQTGTALVFKVLLQDSTGAIVTSGTTSLRLYEIQTDATIKSYDFNDNTFKTATLTTETLGMTHRPGNNAATSTGLWTAALATLTSFTVGAIYIMHVTNTGALPVVQARDFQYGAAEGDQVTLSSTVDGVTLTALLTAMLAKMIGKIAVTDNGNGTATLSFKKRDGSTESFNLTYATANGARTTTGSVS